MKKFIIIVMSAFVLLSGCANSVAFAGWKKIFEFPARRLVTVPIGYAVPADVDPHDHRIYSFRDGDGRASLLFVCHGSQSNGDYYACLGGKFYSDYAAAVDNEIRYHINRGEIRRGSFDKVYFLTCHSGYALQKTVRMPVLQKNLQMILYNKSYEGLLEYFDANWEVYYVVLCKDYPNLPTDLSPAEEKRIIKAGYAEEEYFAGR